MSAFITALRRVAGLTPGQFRGMSDGTAGAGQFVEVTDGVPDELTDEVTAGVTVA